MSTGHCNLATLPHDLQLKVAALLGLPDNRALCLVSSSWVDPCRSRLFRTLDTRNRKTENLKILAGELLPTVAPYIRRMRFHYQLFERKVPAEADVLDTWLVDRDEAFSKIIAATQNLRIATITLHYDNPYATSVHMAKVDRLTLTRFVSPLMVRDSITCFKLDFSMPNSPYRTEQSVKLPLRVLELLSQAKFPSLSHLSLANLSLPLPRDNKIEILEPEIEPARILSEFLSSLPALRNIQLDNVQCSAAAVKDILPQTINTLEIFDDYRHHNLAVLLQALSGRPQLEHLRIVSIGASSSNFHRTVPAPVVLDGLQTLVLDVLEAAEPLRLLNIVSAPVLRRLSLPRPIRIGGDAEFSSVAETVAMRQLELIIRAVFPALAVLEAVTVDGEETLLLPAGLQLQSPKESSADESWKFSSAFKKLE